MELSIEVFLYIYLKFIWSFFNFILEKKMLWRRMKAI